MIMALAIKAIPTLYGNEARRFRDMADEFFQKDALAYIFPSQFVQ